jgi:hypothetical protein
VVGKDAALEDILKHQKLFKQNWNLKNFSVQNTNLKKIF